MGAFAFSLLLLTASTIRTYAQSSLELGIKGGGDYMKIGGRSFDGKRYPGFQAGIYGQLNFTSKWSLQPELNFSQTIGKTSDNLAAAIAGETHEYTDMYPSMARAAREEGFDEIANWFETLAKAERSHANRYTKALEALVD